MIAGGLGCRYGPRRPGLGGGAAAAGHWRNLATAGNSCEQARGSLMAGDGRGQPPWATGESGDGRKSTAEAHSRRACIVHHAGRDMQYSCLGHAPVPVLALVIPLPLS